MTRARLCGGSSLAAVVCAFALTAGLASGSARPAPLKVGALFSLTGGGSIYGPQQLRAARLAVAQVNAAGGVHGAPLELVAVDDKSDPDTGATAMRRLIRKDGVVAVLGPSLSLVAVHADPVANRLHTPVLAVSNTADGIVGDCAYPCSWVWRNSLGESVAVPANIDAYVQAQRPGTAAIMATDGDLLGEDEARLADSSFAANHVRVVARLHLPHEGAVESVVVHALAPKPAVLFIGSTFGAQAAKVIRAARAHGFRGAILGGNTLNSETTTQLAGPAGKGALSGAAWYSGNDFPANAEFVAAYRQAYLRAPDQFAAQAFVGVQILAAALDQAGAAGSIAASRRALQRALPNVALTTALGPFRFNADHDVSQIVWVLAMTGSGGHDLVGFCNPEC